MTWNQRWIPIPSENREKAPWAISTNHPPSSSRGILVIPLTQVPPPSLTPVVHAKNPRSFPRSHGDEEARGPPGARVHVFDHRPRVRAGRRRGAPRRRHRTSSTSTASSGMETSSVFVSLSLRGHTLLLRPRDERLLSSSLSNSLSGCKELKKKKIKHFPVPQIETGLIPGLRVWTGPPEPVTPSVTPFFLSWFGLGYRWSRK